ncbi:MAG: thioredoxin [Lachnospiraceae bacterium]|nr:thioredoxin [Lachnospiraceae bacterium]
MAAIEVSKDNFKTEVLDAEGIVLVDFWASWCAPCRMLSPVVDQVADEVTGAKVVKVNVDKEQELAETYNVMSIPTLIVFKNGQEVKRSMGFIPKEAVKTLLNV